MGRSLLTENEQSRRRFLRRCGGAVASGVALSALGVASSPGALSNPVGYSVISWPQSAYLEAFQTISDLGYQGVQVLGWVQDAYPDGKTQELKDLLQKLKLHPEALSCRGIALRPDTSDAFTDTLRQDADFFSRVGGSVLQITDGGKYDGKYTSDQIKSMAARMNDLGKMAKDSGLTLGYHPHFRDLGETREGQDAYELARQNRPAANSIPHYFCEIGQGVVDFPSIFNSVRHVGFKGWMIVELDSYVVPAGGPGESARINKQALQGFGLRIG
jgi:sugar phosphate isomerase/epimerase